MSNTQTTWKSTLKEAHTKFVAINPEKAQTELGFAFQIIGNSDALQRCDLKSIQNAVVNVARTSVTLNPVMRLAYLVPRKGKCVLDFSYMGLVAMLRDNNCIRSISAHIVFEDEEFDYDVAYNKITHKPRYAKTEDEHKTRQRLGCYSRATLPNGEVVFEFMPMWEIEKAKRLSAGSSDKYSAWQTWEEEMIKKVVIKRHFKMLISGNTSDALATALQIENDNNALLGVGAGGFGAENQLLPQAKPNSLFPIFDFEEEEEEPKSQEKEAKQAIPKSQAKEKPIENSIDFTSDEIDAFLNEEAMKINGGGSGQSPIEPLTKSINLFAEDAQMEEEEPQKDNTDWFPNPPNNG
jgi:recombination protein RecT